MRHTNRQVQFEVEHGQLVRYVTGDGIRGHVQRASLKTLEELCWFLVEHSANGTTTSELWDGLPGLAATQISVALDFLKERGCLVTNCRRNYPASHFLFEDAMINFHALAVGE